MLWKTRLTYQNESRELAETFAEKLTLLKSYFAKKNKLGKKARTELTETFAKNLEAQF
ncbi:MAG: hypothetical protein LC111_00080 [Bacteroidia bacterium]|nr:hypothetical protein [Bacteroidia bacterium]